jgi:hypothetical protein
MLRTTVFLCALAACGDDDRPTPMNDAGAPRTDAGSNDAGPIGPTRTFQYRFVDRDDMPLEGVKVAIDSDRGRTEATSDAMGEVVMTVPYTEERFNFIAAKETYAVVARVRFAMADLPAPEADGFYRVEMGLVVAEPQMMTVTVSATGVPAGGRWCASVAKFVSLCAMEGMSIGGSGRYQGLEYSPTFTAAAFDPTGALVDVVEVPWTTDEPLRHVGAAVFDGMFEMPPTTTPITLTLPTDPMSPYRTATLDATWHGWIVGVTEGSNLAKTWLTNVVISDDEVTANLHSFAPAEDLVWAMAAYADFDDPVRTFRWWEANIEPGPIAVLDVPRVTAAAAWNGDVTWSEPATDVATYQVYYWNNADRLVASLIATETPARLPELPAAFDETTSFPFPGSTGQVQVGAARGQFTMTGTRDPLARNAEAALGPRAEITF